MNNARNQGRNGANKHTFVTVVRAHVFRVAMALIKTDCLHVSVQTMFMNTYQYNCHVLGPLYSMEGNGYLFKCRRVTRS